MKRRTTGVEDLRTADTFILLYRANRGSWTDRADDRGGRRREHEIKDRMEKKERAVKNR